MKTLQRIMGGHQSKTHKIGHYTLHMVKQIAEGGFSYVYLVKDNASSKHFALKRILVRDQEELEGVKHEIDIMQKLKSHKNIVKFIDYSHSKSTNEVFILMEYCSGGHVVDLMMKRQNNRMNEQEILAIFSDICESVAHMHSMSPPIIHRDLKVENVLLDEETGLFKLCDFGSAISNVVYLNNKSDMQIAEEDISKHTTPQYRPPEMVDLYRSKVINEKVDIWALGCLLYKLLYYTTPFEEAGSLGILNGNYIIPTSNYSNEIISLIRYMLHPDVDTRPDIFYITNEVCKMRGHSPIFPGKGQQYQNNPYTSPTLNSSLKENNNSNNSNNNNINSSINNSNNISNNSNNHQNSSKLPPKPPQHNIQVVTPDGFEHMEDDMESPHMRRKSPSAPMQPMVIPQQQQQVPQPIKRRPPPSKSTTPSTTPSMAPLPIPNVSKLESPVAFNLEPQGKSYEIEEIASLIAIATNSDPVFDMESFTKLKSISLNCNISAGNGIMNEIVKRPLREPSVCLKSLLLVHKLLIESNQTFKNDAYDSKDLFNNLYLGWLKQKEKLLMVSDFLSQYSLLIHKLVLFHHKYYLVDGIFSFDENKWPLPESTDSNHPISISCINHLISILEQIFITQNTIIDLSMSSSSLNSIPMALIQTSVNILNSTSFSIYCYISGAIATLSRLPDADTLSALISKFLTCYQILREQYAKLSSHPPFSSDIFFPTLPKSPPVYHIPTKPQQSQPQQQQTINPFDTSGSAEPTFNPFSNSTDSLDPFSSASISPAQSPRTSQYLPPLPLQQGMSTAATSSLSLPQSPVMSRKMAPNSQMIGGGNGGPPLRFPHSASLDDARLYTLILTPSPSPPVSPSFNRSSNNVPTAQFDQLSINPFQLSQQQQQQQQHHQPAQPNLLHPQHHPTYNIHPSQQQQQQLQSSTGNPFDATPHQQQPIHLQKSIGSLMPPPKAPIARGHRRSQSSTTDDMRRRQLLQQQLEQNKEFQMHQRKQRNLMHSSSTEVCTTREMFGDEEGFEDDFDEFSESSSIMTRKK